MDFQKIFGDSDVPSVDSLFPQVEGDEPNQGPREEASQDSSMTPEQSQEQSQEQSRQASPQPAPSAADLNAMLTRMIAERLLELEQRLERGDQQQVKEEEEPPPEPPKRPEAPLDESAWAEYAERQAEYVKKYAEYQNRQIAQRLAKLEEALASQEQERAEREKARETMARFYQEAVAAGLDQNQAREFVAWLSQPRNSLRDVVEIFRAWKAYQQGSNIERKQPKVPPPPPAGRGHKPQTKSPEEELVEALIKINDDLKL